MIRFIAWAAVGVLIMVGFITPIGFLIWIPAVILAAVLLFLGVRSPRYFFALVTGVGATLIALAFINTNYIILVLYGALVVTAGIAIFAAFGPRVSHARAPSHPDETGTSP